MNLATITTPRAPADRPRLDAVLKLLYRVEHTTVHVRSESMFLLKDGWLDVPFEVWKDWRRIRLRVHPDGAAPRTVIMLHDTHGNPLTNGRSGPVRRVGQLDIDLIPAPATGMAFSIVLTGPGNIATVKVSLGLEAHDSSGPGMAELGLMPPPPRVLEVVRSGLPSRRP
jgi:hypothetical protein